MDIPAISCPSCNANVESANHVFFECDIATDMWKLVFRWCDIPLFQASSWDSFNDWIISWHASKEKKHRFYVITTSVLWWLWRYRNSVTFSSQPLRKSDLFDNVRFSSFSWLHNRDHMKLSWNDWLMYPLSITRNGNEWQRLPPADVGDIAYAFDVLYTCTNHAGSNDLLPAKLEEVLYNNQFEHHWLQAENDRQVVVNKKKRKQEVYKALIESATLIEASILQVHVLVVNMDPNSKSFIEVRVKSETSEKLFVLVSQIGRFASIKGRREVSMAVLVVECGGRCKCGCYWDFKCEPQLPGTTQDHLQIFNKRTLEWATEDANKGCEATKVNTDTTAAKRTRPQLGAWDRTLENPTSLIFGRHVDLIELPNDGFPEHYFNFASYNELPARADGRDIPLAAYKAVNRVYMSGDATINCSDRRTIDIQNLSD
ncbi:RNA-directed DNA polymerase, eukaryota, reverse transcriptase zinc-binding domain protein [Tanacetum coccineum]|uniref:RNA-directed DNA polymerase, eukaryota, reverse transcriptase zinc-binding domain protein n=1 Tax=Tanacetum coccineum TaxID=301880 RepID=A0ABQ5F6N7_9ASTR